MLTWDGKNGWFSHPSCPPPSRSLSFAACLSPPSTWVQDDERFNFLWAICAYYWNCFISIIFNLSYSLARLSLCDFMLFMSWKCSIDWQVLNFSKMPQFPLDKNSENEKNLLGRFSLLLSFLQLSFHFSWKKSLQNAVFMWRLKKKKFEMKSQWHLIENEWFTNITRASAIPSATILLAIVLGIQESNKNLFQNTKYSACENGILLWGLEVKILINERKETFKEGSQKNHVKIVQAGLSRTDV